MSAIIYLATNRKNGKRYVGLTSHILSKRRNEHSYAAKAGVSNGAFHRAIRKYGIEVFDFVEIDEVEDMAMAKLAEIDWIKELRPEYNSTRGGDGQLGREVTQKMRDAVRKHSTGNKYRLGGTHTPEVKAALSKLGTENILLFQKYQHLGPAAKARPVVCLDDGKEYPSASAAARFYGVAVSALIELCLGKNYRKTVGKLRFAYVKKEAG